MTYLQACIRTAGPKQPSGCHQQDGQEVEQHAQRTHSQSPSSLALSQILCKYYFCYIKHFNYPLGFWSFSLQIRLNSSILGIEIRHVYNQVFQNKHVSQRCDGGECFERSLSIYLIQANEWSPSQFIAHDPQIPYLHDLLNERVESRLSLTQMRASKYMGGIFFKSTQQLTYFGSSLGFPGSYLQIKNRFIVVFYSGVKVGSCSLIQLGFKQTLHCGSNTFEEYRGLRGSFSRKLPRIYLSKLLVIFRSIFVTILTKYIIVQQNYDFKLILIMPSFTILMGNSFPLNMLNLLLIWVTVFLFKLKQYF